MNPHRSMKKIRRKIRSQLDPRNSAQITREDGVVFKLGDWVIDSREPDHPQRLIEIPPPWSRGRKRYASQMVTIQDERGMVSKIRLAAVEPTNPLEALARQANDDAKDTTDD